MEMSELISGKAGVYTQVPVGLRHWVYWVGIFLVAQALQVAFLTSWQQADLTQLQIVWSNAIVLLGAALLWFLFKWMGLLK